MKIYDKVRNTPLKDLYEMETEELLKIILKITEEAKQALSTIHWIEGIISLKKRTENDDFGHTETKEA